MEARREPRGPPRFDGAEHSLAFLGDRETLAAAIARVRLSLDQARFLEPRDIAGHGGRGHPLSRGELVDADAAVPPDLDQERDLPSGDAERVALAAELAGELQQRGPEPVCDLGVLQ